MKKIMLIGRTGSGKTTLCQRLHQMEMDYHKTQAVTFFDHAIDTPGEYLEQRGYYSALMVTAADADVVALVADATVEESFLPPGLAGAFAKPVIGIVTKCDLAQDSSIYRAIKALREAGAGEIYVVDAVSGAGVDALQIALRVEGGEQDDGNIAQCRH